MCSQSVSTVSTVFGWNRNWVHHLGTSGSSVSRSAPPPGPWGHEVTFCLTPSFIHSNGPKMSFDIAENVWLRWLWGHLTRLSLHNNCLNWPHYILSVTHFSPVPPTHPKNRGRPKRRFPSPPRVKRLFPPPPPGIPLVLGVRCCLLSGWFPSLRLLCGWVHILRDKSRSASCETPLSP